MSNSTVKPEDLGNAIQGAITDYIENVRADLDVNLKGVAQKATRELKKGGSYKEKTGDYTKGWTVTTTQGENIGGTHDVFVVNNRRKAQLTHLLEHGHVSRNGGRVKAYPHIAQVDQQVETWALEAAEKAAKSAGGK